MPPNFPGKPSRPSDGRLAATERFAVARMTATPQLRDTKPQLISSSLVPAFIALAAIAGAIVFWIFRVRQARDAASDLADMAGDVLAAARRLGFQYRTNVHPVDAIEQQSLAAGALTVAFLDLGPGPPSKTATAICAPCNHIWK